MTRAAGLCSNFLLRKRSVLDFFHCSAAGGGRGQRRQPLLQWRARTTQAAAAATKQHRSHTPNPDVTLTSPGHCNTPTGQSFGERSIAQFLLLIRLWTTVVIKIQTGRHRKTVFCELLPRTEACTMVVCNTFVVVLKVIE
jgi:hypothetical protein